MQFRSNGVKWLTRMVIVLVNLTVFTLTVAAPNLPDSANLPRLETQPSPLVITSPTIEKKEGETYPAPLQSQSDTQVTINSNNFNILAAPITNNGGSGNPRDAAGLVDLSPTLGNYTNQQLFVLNVGFTAAGPDSAGNQQECEQNPEYLLKIKSLF